MIIRRMVPEDSFRVSELEKECFSEPWSEKSLQNAAENKDALFVVCELDNEILGYMGMYFVIDEGDIANIAVTQNYRNNKIARKMLEYSFSEAEKRQIKCFTLEVRKSNEAAIHLYESMGFITEGERKNFYTNPNENALIMWKR